MRAVCTASESSAARRATAAVLTLSVCAMTGPLHVSPAERREQRRHPVECRKRGVGRVVGQTLAARAALYPHAAKADVARRRVIQMRACADMHHVVARYA